MPIPVILGIAAAITGGIGVLGGIGGAVEMKEANDTMKSADARHKKNLERFETQSNHTNSDMDKLGSLELEILNSFEAFSEVFEKIQNKPEFKPFSTQGVTIPEYNKEELKEVSVGAGVLLGGLGGAALGTAGGFAAAGATTAAVMAFGTASTGTAISSLSGAAATNATLAFLGGGALKSGAAIAGGMALGSTVLTAASLGVGLMVGGIVFAITGSSLSDKADEAWKQMIKAEEEIDRICEYMKDLSNTAVGYTKSLNSVNQIYQTHLRRLQCVVNDIGKIDWNEFTDGEKLCTENTVLLVGLLYNMCKVQLVKQAGSKGELNTINSDEIKKSMTDAEQVLSEKDFSQRP